MANYCEENYINVGYELYRKGYRVNQPKFTEAQLVALLNGLNAILEEEVTFDQLFKVLIAEKPEWFINEAEEDELYRKENEPRIRKYFADNFEGKSWFEIRSNEELYEKWSSYSDWHKDVFGYRPHAVVCGVYVNPHVAY